jgi:hypothetical protein
MAGEAPQPVAEAGEPRLHLVSDEGAACAVDEVLDRGEERHRFGDDAVGR